MMPPAGGSCCDELDNRNEEGVESSNEGDDGLFEDGGNDAAPNEHDTGNQLGSLDDEALFGIVKKIVFVSLRKLIYAANGTVDADNHYSNIAARGKSSHGTASTKAVTRLSISYFSDALESLNPDKRKVIVLRIWLAATIRQVLYTHPVCPRVVDHVQVSSSDIVVKNRSILLSPQTVHDVLGIPIGGRIIKKADSDNGKGGFLNAMNLTSLPYIKFFGDNLMRDHISDDDLVRSFLIVALTTFLCPNSNTHPSTEYLQPLVDVQKAKEWDWSSFVHYWLLKQIKKYNVRMKKADHASITMGGCMYIICVEYGCVVYLDFLNFGQQQLPPTLPRLVVWKGDMIKEKSKLDSVQGHSYGKRPILPLKLTCYYKKTGNRSPFPTCVIDGSNFKKSLIESVHGCASAEV